MQILIIGAAGMVGRKLTNHLVAKGQLGGRTISRLTLHDVIDPGLVAEASFTVDTFASDFSDPNEADKLQLRFWRMSELTVQYLVLERCDPARNMARFYVLTIEPTLFGDTALVRKWGVSASAAGGASICSLGGCRPSRHLRPGSCAKPVVATSGEIPQLQ